MCRNHQKYLIWIFAQKLAKIVIKFKYIIVSKIWLISIFKHCDVLEKNGEKKENAAVIETSILH